MLLSPLPDDARVWLFAADGDLSPDEAAALLDDVRAALGGWVSHGRPVTLAAECLHGRVLVVGATLGGDISGCGIDQMVHAVEAVAQARGVRWLGGLDVAFVDEAGALRAVPRAEFRRLVRERRVTAETRVLDLTTETAGELRARGVLRPAGAAWHGRAFGLASAAAA